MAQKTGGQAGFELCALVGQHEVGAVSSGTVPWHPQDRVPGFRAGKHAAGLQLLQSPSPLPPTHLVVVGRQHLIETHRPSSLHIEALCTGVGGSAQVAQGVICCCWL
jgi:hypothetical protein